MSNLTWRHTGAWPGGAVHSLALSLEPTPNPIALAATDAGVFRSADGGRSWGRGREGGRDLAYAAAHVVVIAPGQARIAFAATRDGGLFRSQDDGASWQRMAGWAFGVIAALVLSPNFGADATVFAATPNGVYRSLDGGRSWQSANFGLLDSDVLCLACAPDFANTEVVWTGSAAGGVYRSRNAGRAWRESGEGLADSAVQCLAYANSTLFAGTEGSGVFCLAHGAQWESCGLEGRAVNSLAACDGAVLAGTDAGVFRSDDEGRTWVCILDDDTVLALAAAPNGNVLAGGMATGVQASADGGRTWQRAEGLAAHVPPLAALAPNGDLFLFDVAGGAAYSSDGDCAWQEIGLSDGPLVCAATSGTAQQSVLWAATERAVLRWQAATCAFETLAHQPNLPSDDAICALSATPEGTLLLGTRTGSVAILLNGSAVWHRLTLPGANAIHTVQLTPTGSLLVLCLVPTSDANTAFSAEVWNLPALVLPMAQPSEDWRLVVALDALRNPLACMTVEEERVVLAGQNMIVMTSLDAGDAHTAALPDEVAITAMVAARGGLFAGSNRGVFASNDAGATWQPCANALNDVPVVALLFADAQGLCAITLGGDVWNANLLRASPRNPRPLKGSR